MTNRELAEAAFAALDKRDLEAFLEIVHPDVEFTSMIAEAEGQTFRSIGGLSFTLKDLEDLGDRGVAAITVSGTFGGTPISQTMYQVVRVREGKLARWEFFRTREEAQAALEART